MVTGCRGQVNRKLIAFLVDALNYQQPKNKFYVETIKQLFTIKMQIMF